MTQAKDNDQLWCEQLLVLTDFVVSGKSRAIAAGLLPNLTWNPLEQAATITAYIVQVSLGDLPHGTIEYQTIFAAGLTLVLMTLVLNLIGYFLSRHFREIY